jgi:acyl-coenzyme A synthetase/AMP-(fatty) acid ligase/acyl carrier protein
MARPEGHKEPAYLAGLIQAHGVTTLHFVPSMLQAMLNEEGWRDCRSLRRVFCSGEALPAEVVKRHYAMQEAPLHNLYGPTEAAIDVSYWPCPRELASDSVPIGWPIQNTSLLVLNRHGQLQPAGVAGELHIGGVGLARGYLRRPDLTAQRFIAHPFEEGARLYKTGDLARRLADGSLEYLGRIDEQVKIRGFRIELGEIEHALAQHSGVDAAVVLAREDRPGEKRLVAYVVAAQAGVDGDADAQADANPDKAAALADSLRAHLRQSLPDYMVPARYVVLERLPVTPNGKVDKKALPAPDASLLLPDYVAPATGTERQLAAIWAELLHLPLEQVGADANFFALGGDSLLLMRLGAKIRTQFQRELELADVFVQSSLSKLAAKIDLSGRDADDVRRRAALIGSAADTKPSKKRVVA